MKRLLLLIAAFFALASPALAADNYTATQGSGKTFGCKDITAVCYPYFIPFNSSGTEIFTSAAPGQVTGANGTFPASQSGSWSVTVVQPTGTNLHAVIDTGSTTAVTGNVTVIGAIANGANGQATTSTNIRAATYPYIFNGTTFDTIIGSANALNSTGTGLAPAQVVGQFDDVAPTSITENQFGNLRMSANRNLYGTIRDAAGNERGVNVNASNQLSVSCDNGCSASTAITSWGGGTLGAMANYGTSPGAVLVPGVNAFITNANTNGQATMSASSPVVIASNQSAVPVSTADVCASTAKINLPISFQTTSITQLIALSGSTKIYVCSLSLIASIATVFSVTGGTGTNCGTPAALIGTTSATHGLSLAANGGMTLGNGAGTVAVTGAGSELCIVQSGAGDLVGNLTYVQQ